MSSYTDVSRRRLIQLMAMSSPAMAAVRSIAGNTAPEGIESDHAKAWRQQRPRLFYNHKTLAGLERSLDSNSTAGAALRGTGERLLAESLIPEEVAAAGGGQQAHYALPGNQITEMGLTLGLLFHLTGDKRYAEKLREALLYYVKYDRWAGPGLADRTPQWHSELDTAKFSFGYASGYDALRDFLSAEDRKKIADGMVRLGAEPILSDWILPGTRVHSFDSMGHNWWGVCVAGGGLCALALLGDDPRAQEWIDAVDQGFSRWFKYGGNVLQNRMPTFEPSGPSYEGVHYTNYAVSEYLHYRFAWQNTYPGRRAAQMKPLEHVASYFLQTLYPTRERFYSLNFDDALLDDDSTVTIWLLIACGYGTADAQRYLDLVHTHPQDTLLSLLRQHPKPEAHGKAPLSSIYTHLGWATMRSSWQNDATMLAMKSGYTWNHAHADAGSFVLFQRGMPLIIDSGTCTYSRPEYNSYYRFSKAHNVILFDGAGQPEEDINSGCKFPGHMNSLIDGLGLKYVYADATGPMARWFKRNYRHWLWTGDVILIVDAVFAYKLGRLDWLLHFEGKYKVNDSGSVTLSNKPAEAVFQILYPTCSQREEVGLAVHDPDRHIPYLVFTPESSMQSQQFISAICLNPQALPDFEVVQKPNYISVRVRTLKTVEEMYINLRSVNGSTSTGISIDDWSTDAYLLHITRSDERGAVQRYFVSDGSYLRKGNRSHLESLSKLTICWTENDTPELVSDGASDSIQIGAAVPPRTVRWNGTLTTGVYDRQRQLVSLQSRH